MNRFAVILALVLPMPLVAGCGSKGPLRVPVKGTVTLDGTPLAAAVVKYVPISQVAGNGGHGRTGSKGYYKVVTYQGKKGLPPGDYLVTIEKRVMPDGSDYPFHADQWPDVSVTRQILPAKYASPRNSVLKPTVTKSTAKYDFPLESGG
jgi:hypothetical protein